MPDVTLVLRGLSGADDAERLERAVTRLGAVEEVNVDSEKGLLAVSYEGGEAELGRIEEAVRDAGYEYELSPGAREAGGD
jgi:copper chaperone CopZ